ncbi:MAG TPA: hypothetical protein VIS29_18335 [Streptomyces sp.]
MLSAVLALIVAGWIVRDVQIVGDPLRLLRYWAGLGGIRPGISPGDFPATGQSEAVLLVVYLLVVAAALRSPVAASALVTTGIVTVVLRLPGLWTLGSSWMEGRYADGLRTRAMICTFVALAAGLALIVTGAAGRRPVEGRFEQRPGRPGRGASATAFLALSAAGAVLAAWEVRRFIAVPPSAYRDWLLGGWATPVALTVAPPGWGNVTLAVLCLVVAFTALFHAVHARPLGMIAAGLLLGTGGLGVDRFVHHGELLRFGEMGAETQLMVVSSFLLAFAGAAGLTALAGRGAEEEGQGYAAGPGGYGCPPQGGGFGPPPPSSPPPNW